MVGLLIWKAPVPKKRQRAVTVREIAILHARFMQVEVLRSTKTPGPVLRRRIDAAGRALQKRGVTRAVLPAAFEWKELMKITMMTSTRKAMQMGEMVWA